MSLRSHVVAQFRQPTGLLGTVAGWIMAYRPSNRERNRWTVDLLSLAPSDRVLEVGFGPGLAIARAAERVSTGKVTGLEHSNVMLAQARWRNRNALRDGRVELQLGGLDRLPEFQRVFDKVFSINVLQFVGDRPDALHRLHRTLAPGGLLATTYQPRHRGASAADADTFAIRLATEMSAASFANVRVETLPLRPVPAVCVLGTAA